MKLVIARHFFGDIHEITLSPLRKCYEVWCSNCIFFFLLKGYRKLKKKKTTNERDWLWEVRVCLSVANDTPFGSDFITTRQRQERSGFDKPV